MQLTHFGHSCLLAEFRDGNGDEVTVLFDPGTLAHGFEGITGLSEILITHQHPDHVDRARLPALVEANPQAALYADPMTTSQLGGSWRAVNAGDAFSVGHLSFRGMGGTHAVVHPDIPLVDNISYLVGDRGHPARLMHPGDALYVPDEPVEVLAAPATAPWLKISEAIDYLRAVAPMHAVPIHQGAVAKEARSYYYDRLSEMTDTDLRILPEENGMQF
jgi:L-ascorbate metabolism protein UlaG (beta-lactamase superfamily)